MSAKTRAGILVRISDDRDGEAAGVARQEADCRALAKQLGWPVAEAYTENDTSAYKRRTVTLPDGSTAQRVLRPEFRRLLNDLSTGLIDAVIAYDLDRVARDPRDLEDLIDAVEARRVPVRSVTGSLDLSNDSGITMARVMVAMANKSSRDTSRRVQRKQQDMAKLGLPAGGGLRPYGYTPPAPSKSARHDAPTTPGLHLLPDEAAVVRRIAAAILHDRTLNEIAVALNADGIPTVTGVPWSSRSVASTVTKPTVAGLRVYRGEVIGQGAWEPILDEETWTQVKLTLDKRAHGSTNNLKRWLTGLLTCSHCGRGLIGWQGNPRQRYWCATPRGGCGKTTVDAPRAEDAIEAMILGYLQRPDVLESLRVARNDDTSARLRDEIAATQKQMEDLARIWAEKQITLNEFLAARKVLDDELKSLRGRAHVALPSTVRAVLAADDITAAWSQLDPAARRDVAKAVFPDGIEVLPGRGGRRFHPERLQPVGWAA